MIRVDSATSCSRWHSLLSAFAATASAQEQPQTRRRARRSAFRPTPRPFDPIYSVQFTERQVLYVVYNTLVRYGTDFSIQPELAESWKIEDGGKRIVFKLREGVKFHDGTALQCRCREMEHRAPARQGGRLAATPAARSDHRLGRGGRSARPSRSI